MAYIGNSPTSVAFLTDYFTGNGSTTSFTMSVAPATTSSILVTITGVVQDPSTYGINGTTLTFSPGPPTGSIVVRYLGIPASGVVTTAYRTVTEFTATAGQTTFSPPSYTAGFINVFRNGVRLSATNFTATNGTSVVLGNAASVGDLIVIESFQVSSLNNALPITGGTINSVANAIPLIVQSNGVTGLAQDSSGNVGVGTTSPTTKLHVQSAGSNYITSRNSVAGGLAGLICQNGSDTRGIRINDASLELYDFSAGASRLTIDGAGRITTPAQPAFIAYVQNEQSLTFNTNHQISQYYNLTDINRGNHYNTSNGRFTAPVTGVYQFNFKYYLYPIASTEAFFFVNGTDHIRFQQMFNYSGNTNPGGYLGSALVRLTAGDFIALHMNFNTVGGSNASLWNGGPRSSTWSGYLVG